jgi:hypothetical protein
MKLTFNTPQGAVEGDFASDKPLKELKAQVLEGLRLPPAWADQYVVASEDTSLDDSRTLADLQIAEGATLVLWRVSSTHASRGRTSS